VKSFCFLAHILATKTQMARIDFFLRLHKYWYFAAGGAALAVLASLTFLFYGASIGLFGKLPSKKQLAAVRTSEASLVYSSDGRLIGSFFKQNRSAIGIGAMPPHLIEALIATEDARFWDHHGIDAKALARVAFKSLLLRDQSAGGGSTISQQLAKNLYGRRSGGRLGLLATKLREMEIARRLEKIYSKNEILELYLNTVSFGENVYGAENAALRYFGRSCADLRPDQSAVLVGILKANTTYNPKVNPANALQRRNTVLAQMHKYGYISKAQADSLSSLPLGLQYTAASQSMKENGYFLQHIRPLCYKIVDDFNSKNGTELDIDTDGLVIVATLDKQLQDMMQAALIKHLKAMQPALERELRLNRFWANNTELLAREAEKLGLAAKLDEKKSFLLPYYDTDTVVELSYRDSIIYGLTRLQSAVVAADPATGAVLAWIGGANYQLQPYDRALAQRQVGSTFKPIAYYAALEHGMKPCKFFANEQVTYDEWDGWAPGNADGKYQGFYSAKGALAASVNTVSVQVMLEAGIDNVISAARKMGIRSDIPQVPSIVLGTAGISLSEMVQAYSCIASLGYYNEMHSIKSITTKSGQVIYQHKGAEPKSVLHSESAQQLVEMLLEAVAGGTGRAISGTYGIKKPVAGKTGTTQGNTDAWFIGFTPKITMGVWTGLDNPAISFYTSAGQGSSAALPIWAMGMRAAERSPGASKYFGRFQLDPALKIDCENYREDKPSLIENIFGTKEARQSRRERQQPQSKKDSGEDDGKRRFRLFNRK
jgi:penicillin-binding protein 1A